MHEFWKHGYSNTSLRDLLKAMEIGESSFYHLLGSKKDLYLQCIQRYNGQVSARRIEVLENSKTAREGVAKFFKVILDDLEDRKMPTVCLMANSLSRDVLEETELQDYVLESMKFFEEVFYKRFERARTEGELSIKFDSRTAAQIVVTYLQGFFRVVRVLKTRKEMERQINSLMDGLGLGRKV
jgi:TetR/AcrR family transcriptional repressor of nem operon